MLLELQMDNNKALKGLLEQVNVQSFKPVDTDGLDTTIEQTPDTAPNWDCFYQDSRDFSEYFRFSGRDTQLQTFEL